MALIDGTVFAPNPPITRVLLWLSRHASPRTFRLACGLIGADIPYRLHARVFLPHPHGIVVNGSTSIGDYTLIYQNVTIGTKHPLGQPPHLGRNVFVGAGAIILGDIRVGDNARIAAGAVVLSDVPSGATVAGNPATIVDGKHRSPA